MTTSSAVLEAVAKRPNHGWTYEEWIQLPDTPESYEIIGGELHLPPAPDTSHQTVSSNVDFVLQQYVRAQRIGRVLTAPCDLLLPDGGSAQPDLLFISKDRLDLLGEKNIQGAPDLVVEILSPTSSGRDRVLKMRTYAALGVAFYWILDPMGRTLEEYQLREGIYALVNAATGEETFTSALFPDLAVSLSEIWE